MFVSGVHTDWIVNNGRSGWSAQGDVAQALADFSYDPGMLRPYIDAKGRNCVTVNTGRRDRRGRPVYEKRLVSEVLANGIVLNAPTTLRKDEWISLDRAIMRAARSRLRAWNDLASVSSYSGFDGMGTIMLEHEMMSDPGEAFVDMDGMTEGRNDAPTFTLQGLPLPITHSDFWFSARKLAVTRRMGTPIDTTMAEAAGRRIAERVEKTLIGIETGITFGTDARYVNPAKVYGYTNFPDRIIKNDLTTPTGSNASVTISEVIEMRELLYADNFYGPFMLYHSPDWDAFLDQDYILTGGNVATQTLRQRIEEIDGISGVRRLDYLPSSTNPFTLILVQMTAEVARAVIGMNLTTIQWEALGGMRRNFKVMTIMVPQLRSDPLGRSGIVHATTS